MSANDSINLKLFHLVKLRKDYATFLAISLSVLMLGSSFANAAQIFSVNTTANTHDILRGDGVCRTEAGKCSLRAALEESNALPGEDTVRVPMGTYPIDQPDEKIERNKSLQILDDVRLAGAGYPTIDGQAKAPILWVRNHESLVIDHTAHEVKRMDMVGNVKYGDFADLEPTPNAIALKMELGNPGSHPDGHDIYIGTYWEGIKRYSDETGQFIETFIEPMVNGERIIIGDFVFRNGIVYVADYTVSGDVLKFDGDTGDFIGTFLQATGQNQLQALLWYKFEDTNAWELIVGDTFSGDILRYDENGVFVGYVARGMHTLRDMVIREDILYISVENRDAVEHYDLKTGTYLGRFVGFGAGGLDKAGGLEWGPQGDLYVRSGENNKILAFDRNTGEYARTYIDGDDLGINVGAFVFRPGKIEGPVADISELTLNNGYAGELHESAGLNNSVGSHTILTRVNITNGHSDTFGGGIGNWGSMTIESSTISSNEVKQPSVSGFTARGGGIYNLGVMVIRNSVINDNFGSKGGGISQWSYVGSDPWMLLENTTISGNRSYGQGGGIGVVDGYIKIVNSTITLNATRQYGGEDDPYGGGVFVGAEGLVDIANSIVANNSYGTILDGFFSPDCFTTAPGKIRSYGNNIIGLLNDNCDLGDSTFGDLRGIMSGTEAAPLDAGLLDLDDNGGLTLSHALSYNSPAIDAVTMLPSPVSQFDCPDFDQRGEPRPADGNLDSTKICDIGAYELLRQTTMLEAENAELTGALESGTCSGASGGECVSAFSQDREEHDAPNPNHRIVFDINIEVHNLYNIAGWVKASAPADNSFWVGVDGSTPWIWDLADTDGSFEAQLINNRGTGDENNPEVEAVSFLLDEGHHTLEIYLREDDAMLDRISLTPVAIEPVVMLSMNQPVEVSSESAPQYQAFYVVDGDSNTRWRSAETDDEWVQVDLGETKLVSSVVLDWSSSFGEDYEIQISGDGETWTTLYEQVGGDGGIDEIAVNGTGRYVRLQGIKRGMQTVYSLREFEVYGAPIVEVEGESPSDLSAVFSVSNDWGSGFCGDFLVTNNGSEPVTGWSVSVDLNNSILRPDSWNGIFSDTTGVITVEPGFSWNETIAAGATDGTVGICADRDDPASGLLPLILDASP